MYQPIATLSLAEFERNTREHVEQLEATKRALALTVNGRTRAVVLSVEDYEKLIALADRSDAIEALRRGLEDVKAGRMTTLEAFDLEMRRSFKKGGAE